MVLLSTHNLCFGGEIRKLFFCYAPGKVFRILEQLPYLGIWFQEFDDHRDADDAVYELNGKELCGERYIHQ